jgi:predicted transcriptional regulator
MEVAKLVHEHGELSAAEIVRHLSVPIGSSAVRSMLRRLEGKGVVRRRKEGKRFVYLPSSTEAEMRRRALVRVASEHFGGCLGHMAREARKLVDEQAS